MMWLKLLGPPVNKGPEARDDGWAAAPNAEDNGGNELFI